ncbi:glycosyltransferase family 4 protein [Mucilaginibacter achroorhodeus]|uniref:Glycosyltransferase family 4 protein n=1 Tax=Mucilaginibacter achroorhodeus TaxID=2599294 RepID=A0A563U169_9SPHI|nr:MULTISPECIES: glycosyltransferase family 4 protein [Mucilaginibacter]QXV67509.1 glycosyltransferase family 4 protein [Mucilaginibacter sp. 21P]TWR25385.1 glycosyltransferase family 4 protein [Mucilaginibacter achroorhodeus]
MKIAITADPFIPVPPELYGGIERIIDILIAELVNRGHEVTLFAHENSNINCKLIPYKTDKSGLKNHLSNACTINKYLLTNKVDIVHSFGRLAYLLPLLPLRIPKLMSYQREPTLSQIKKVSTLSRSGSLSFTGCSNYIADKIAPLAPAYTIYNCVDVEKYVPKYDTNADAPFVFLGRIEPIKGPHIAVEIAQATGKKLILAGNVPTEHRTYFETMIKPFLGDQIQYVGAVNDLQKNELLGKAMALLMPILWNEPFGIVMIEAMACGTPVVALNRGAVPEVVISGLTGFIGDTMNELIKKISLLNSIDRKAVRATVENRFSSEIIASNYLDLYEQLIDASIPQL